MSDCDCWCEKSGFTNWNQLEEKNSSKLYAFESDEKTTNGFESVNSSHDSNVTGR